MNNSPVALTQVEIMEAMTLGIPLYTHPVKELTDRISELENQLGFIANINRAGLGVITAIPMSSEKIEKIWNAIEEQKDDNFHYGWKKCEQYYGFAHPVKKLHLSLQKSKQTGELLAVTYTDDEHRIVEVLWQRPPVKELDEDFDAICLENKRLQAEIEALKDKLYFKEFYEVRPK